MDFGVNFGPELLADRVASGLNKILSQVLVLAWDDLKANNIEIEFSRCANAAG